MDQATVLSKMKAHFEATYPADMLDMLENFENKRATELLTESIDVVEFLVYLEDELGERIDVNRVGPALANMTFGELAAELCRELNQEPPGEP